MQSPIRKVAWFQCLSCQLLSTYIDLRTVNFFPPAESWLVNSNFPRISRMQGGTCDHRRRLDQTKKIRSSFIHLNLVCGLKKMLSLYSSLLGLIFWEWNDFWSDSFKITMSSWQGIPSIMSSSGPVSSSRNLTPCISLQKSSNICLWTFD